MVSGASTTIRGSGASEGLSRCHSFITDCVTSASGRINEDRAGAAHEGAAAEIPPIRRVRHRESDRGRG